MAQYIVTNTELIAVADMIRTKGETSANLVWPSGYISAIQAIPSGGGGGTAILSGSSPPLNSEGNNGDIYAQYKVITQIEYLQSTGGQWFSTDYLPKSNSKYVLDFDLVAPYNTYDTPFGSRSNQDVFVAYNGGTYRYIFGTSNQNVANISAYYGQRVQMILENGRAAVEQNGTTLVEQIFTATLNSMVVPMGVFSLQTSAAGDLSSCRARGSMRSFKIYEDNIQVAEFIPVIDDNNIPCAYNLYDASFHYNLGSGDFTGGSNVTTISPIFAVYIKVNGTWQNMIGLLSSDIPT